MLVQVTKDIWVDPKKVEMVILEKGHNHDGHSHDPFVVLGFQGGGGRTLPSEVTLEDVVTILTNGERATTPPVFNSYIQNNDCDRMRIYIYGLIAMILFFIGGALIF